MTVSTKQQPNNATQVGAPYKGAIDATTHVHDRIAGAFACHQNDQGSPDAPDMTVRVDAGALVRAGLVPLEVAAQSTGAFTAPAGNSRNDIIYIDNSTGAVGVATGTEAASPSDPAVPAAKTAVARVTLFVGMTEITNADIDDLRVAGSAPEFTGPDTSGSPATDGSAGSVPAPTAAQAGYFLRTDGWAALADEVARNMAAAAMAEANLAGTPGTKGPFYLVDSFPSDTLSVKTNATYDSGGDYYGNADTADLLTGGTASASSADGASVASNASDNNTGTFWQAGSNQESTGWWGYDLGAGNAKKISRIRQYWDGSASGIETASIKASNTGAFSGEEVTVATVDFNLNAGAGWYPVDFTAPAIEYRYWRIYSNSTVNTANALRPKVFEWEAILTTQDMTLRPAPVAMDTADPTDIMGYFLFEIVDAVTFGTDVLGKVSIADGSPEDWVTGSWTNLGNFGTYELWRLDVDLSAKTGSTLEYSIETQNQKEIRFKACVGLVPLY